MTCKGCKYEYIYVPFGVYNPCRYCYKFDHYEPIKKESENSWSISSKMGGESNLDGSPNDSKDSFYNSYPVSELTPEQRKHFKVIIRKEIKGHVAE